MMQYFRSIYLPCLIAIWQTITFGTVALSAPNQSQPGSAGEATILNQSDSSRLLATSHSFSPEEQVDAAMPAAGASREHTQQSVFEKNTTTALLRFGVETHIRCNDEKSELSSGELLVEARRDTLISSAPFVVHLRKGAVVLIDRESDVIKIRNLSDERTDSVQLYFDRYKASDISPGHEVVVARNAGELSSSIMGDNVTRRNPGLVKLSGGALMLRGEFSIISLMQHNSLLKYIYHSAVAENKLLERKLLKMTASINIACQGRGDYKPMVP